MLLDVQQTLIDELIRVIMRRKDVTEVGKAESYAQFDFEMVTKDRKFTRVDLPYADSLERLAKLQHNIPQKLPIADENMTLVLQIRKDCFGNTTDKQKKLILADTSVILAKIRESRDILTESTENLLKSATSIYAVCREEVARGTIGTPFPFINTIDAELARLSLRINRRTKSEPQSSDDDKDEETASPTRTAKRSTKRSEKTPKRTTGETYTFAPDDGQGRMRAAATLYDEEHFSDAVVILQDAHALFNKQYGTTHPYTENAKNNLMLAINQEINCLWREVILEMNEI